MKDKFKDLIINKQIEGRVVDLVGDDGKVRNNVPLEEAMAAAEACELDLVQLNVRTDGPNDEVPICKIMNYSKYRYQKQKKQSVQAKKNIIKEVQMKINIDTNDYNVKLRAMEKFLNSNFKVVVILRLFGREMMHQDLGLQLLQRVADDLQKVAKVEKGPLSQGRRILMMLRRA